MPPDYNGTITECLRAIDRGDDDAKERLWEAVEGELRVVAEGLMRQEPAGHTLQATALVNEAFIRLRGGEGLNKQGRAYFFRAAVLAMRRILIEHGRREAGHRREVRAHRVPLEFIVANKSLSAESEGRALEAALRELESDDSQTYDVVTFRCLCGLTVEQTADLLDVSTRTVKRRFKYGQTWLHRHMEGADGGDTS